jgi:tRNA-dihydrouridine synthase
VTSGGKQAPRASAPATRVGAAGNSPRRGTLRGEGTVTPGGKQAPRSSAPATRVDAAGNSPHLGPTRGAVTPGNSEASRSIAPAPGPLMLGRLALQSPFLLAPMESVSDAAFRRLCWEQGAGFTWTEMIRARGLVRNNRSTIELIDSHDPEVPTGVQLMVVTEQELSAALEKLDALAATTHPFLNNLRAVDLNFGCPSPAVIAIGAGPALLKRRAKLELLFRTLRSWSGVTRLPIAAVGAKIRLGLNRPEQDQKVYLPVVELANTHLDYLVVHARHARAGSDEPALWSAIAEAKARARVPLIGNGDVATRDDYQQLVAETGADGAMVARAAIRSPWVFRELTGRGQAGPASLAELDEAERHYDELATRFGSKDKFRAWHREGFERMRRRLRGEQAPTALPPNEHMR